MSLEITWRRIGDAFAARYARSVWRLPLLLVGSATVLLLPLYLLRGLRLVRLCLVGIAGLVVAAVGFERPFLTLALALFLAFSGLGAYLPVGSAVAALLLLVAARVVWDLLDGARFDPGTFAFRLSLGVLLAAITASMLVAHNWTSSLSHAYSLGVGLTLYVVLSQLATTPQRIAASLAAVSTGICIATLVVVRGLMAASSQLERIVTEARFGGLGGDPNVQAAIANCLLPPTMHLLGRLRGFWRLPLLVILLSLIAAIILSQSRAGMALLGVLLLFLVLRERRARPFAIAGCVALGVVAAFLPHIYWVRFASFGQLAGIVVDRSLQVRKHVLAGGLETFFDHPLFGVGFGNFGEASPHFMLGDWVAHNSYVEVAATLGIFGFLAYLGLLASGFLMSRQASRAWRSAGRPLNAALADSIGLGLVAFALMAATLSIELYTILWVLLGLANAARRASTS